MFKKIIDEFKKAGISLFSKFKSSSGSLLLKLKDFILLKLKNVDKTELMKRGIIILFIFIALSVPIVKLEHKICDLDERYELLQSKMFKLSDIITSKDIVIRDLTKNNNELKKTIIILTAENNKLKLKIIQPVTPKKSEIPKKK